MKRIVCFSGGHSSAIAAIEIVRKYGKENVVLLNHDISTEVEHQDIKRFKNDISEYLKIDITYANMKGYESLTPIRIAMKEGAFQVRAGQALCTNRLKTAPFHAWLAQNLPVVPGLVRNDASVVYGFDADEQRRIVRRKQIMYAMGYETDFPLTWENRTLLNTEEIGIAKPITYRVFKHANCIGCLKAGRQHWYIVYCLYPQIFKEAIEAEIKIGYSIIKGVFLEELIPRYESMKSAGVCPNDKMNSATFWAKVRKALPEEADILPCDCMFY